MKKYKTNFIYRVLRLLLNVSKEVLRNAPGFDKDNWPESADRSYLARVYRHYGYQPYWEKF